MKFCDEDMYLVDIKKDSIQVLTAGEYSDYQLLIVTKALRDFSPTEVIKQYLTEFPAEEEDYDFRYYKFIIYLIHNNYVEELQVNEWYIDSSIRYMRYQKIDNLFDEER